MKALVTGGAGFIGSHICDALIKEGHEVVCVDNLVAGKAENIETRDTGKIWPVFCDVRDVDERHFEGVDAVFHNAASKCTVCMDDPALDLAVNAQGTLHVLQCAQKAGVKKFIHASTGSVNNGRPASFYGVSKQAGESYVRVFSQWVDCNILRYYHVYGPRQDDSDKGGVIPIFIRHALKDEPITVHGDGQQVRHFTHVSDVVAANLWMLNVSMKYTREFDLISDTKVTIIALAHMIKELTGSNSEIVFADPKPGDIKHFSATSDSIRMTGFKFKKKFEKGLIETVEWYSKQS